MCYDETISFKSMRKGLTDSQGEIYGFTLRISEPESPLLILGQIGSLREFMTRLAGRHRNLDTEKPDPFDIAF